MKSIIAGAVAGAILLASPCFADTLSSGPAETLNNASVIQLVRAGLGNEAVIAKIKSTPGKYDLSTDDLISLKNAGVPGEVIAAMLTGAGDTKTSTATMSTTDIDPAVPHPSGLYLIDTGVRRLNRIEPTVSSQAKTGGIFGYALTMGIASMSVKVAIAGDQARAVSSTPLPEFYFFFDASNPQTANLASTWASGSAQTVSSPSEFSLIKLEAKGGRREAKVGSMNIAGAKSGVMDKDRIPFDFQMVREGVYKVTPKQVLRPGQYAFIYALAGSGTNGAMSARIFDFAVSTGSTAAK